MDDLIVDTQREGDEGTGLDELAISQLSLADVLQEDFIETIESIGRGYSGNVDLLAAVVDAIFAVHLGTTDPGDETDGEGDDIVELVLLLNLMNLHITRRIQQRIVVSRYIYTAVETKCGNIASQS